jgi:ornithine carbamoyltransferase
MNKDLTKMADLSQEEIFSLLDLAAKLKYEKHHGITHHLLPGKSLGMIFQKSSTRTRVSFETGIYQLGGQALFLSPRDLQIGRGEPLIDTARVLSRYLDGIMIRTFAQSEVDDLAKYCTCPVINGLTDYCHPCQILADLLTVREFKCGGENDFSKLKMCYIGDGNNMANSLIVGGLTVGMSVAIGCPTSHQPHPDVLAFTEKYPGKFLMTDDIYAAASGADILFTDVWASMGQESEARERQKIFAGYQINNKLLEAANPGVMVQHCLPAHRGEEISEDVFEAHANEIFEEAENRLHAQKAVMVQLMSK